MEGTHPKPETLQPKCLTPVTYDSFVEWKVLHPTLETIYALKPKCLTLVAYDAFVEWKACTRNPKPEPTA